MYDFLRDLLVPGLAGVGGVLVGVGAIVVAHRSNALAEQVRTDELTREADAAEERYLAQLGHFIETAITSLVDYGNAVEKHPALVGAEGRMHAATQARLVLVNAVARGDDALPTQAAYEVFHELGHQRQYRIRRNVTGLLTGALAQTLARQNSPADIEKAIRSYIPSEEEKLANFL